MRLSITMPDALVAQIEKRTAGRGRSAAIAAIVSRYLSIVGHEQRSQPPHQQDISIIAGAVLDGLDAEGAAGMIAAEPLSRISLLDAAEQHATVMVAEAKKGRGK